jgi:hypothetical protein
MESNSLQGDLQVHVFRGRFRVIEGSWEALVLEVSSSWLHTTEGVETWTMASINLGSKVGWSNVPVEDILNRIEEVLEGLDNTILLGSDRGQTANN